MHPAHREILAKIKQHSGAATKHTFLENYLGNAHPKYPISNPVMREIGKAWAKENRELSAAEFRDVVDSLVKGKSFNEKLLAGVLLGYATSDQRKFDIAIFDDWLDNLEGWAEIDSLCTGKFSLHELVSNFAAWSRFLKKLSKSKSITKQRASLVFYCSPISHCKDSAMAEAALANIDSLKNINDILITKAISWLLRSMVRHHGDRVKDYLDENESTLPKIAIRETSRKLETGKKTGPRKKVDY